MRRLTFADINKISQKYTVGSRVSLVSMNDPQAPPKGTHGTVLGVDYLGQIAVHWDNGSRLNLIPEVDRFRKIKA